MKRSFIFRIIKYLILVLTIVQAAFAQSKSYNISINFQPGYPIIKNYLPKEYKAHNQNWAIVKDQRGIMYFGNSAGVLEFDGQSWNLIKVTNGIVRSMCADDKGTIFVGAADDLGYLVRDSKNATLRYKSLMQYIPTKENFGHVWHTFFIDKSIFFITKNFIFQFTFSNNKYTNPVVKFWKTKSRYRIAHKVREELYVLDSAEGLLRFGGNSFNKLSGSEIFLDNTIYSMLPYDDTNNTILIATKKGELFIYNGLEFIPFKTEASEFLQENNIYLPGVKLPDNSFVFNTSKNGVVFIDKTGKIIRKINMTTGIPDDGVIYTLYSNDKLWLALQNGISVIDIPSPVAFLNQTSGLKGSVSDVKIFNNKLFAASTAGIFFIDLQKPQLTQPRFVEIPNIAQEGWQFLKHKNKILTALTDGVYQVDGLSLTKLSSKWTGCYSIYSSSFFPSRIYVALETGFAVLDEINGKWIDRGKITGVNTAIRNIAEDKYGNLWLGSSYAGVYKVSNLTNDLFTPPIINHISDKHIMPDDEVKIFETKYGLLFATKREVLVFDQTNQSFEPENIIGFNKHFDKAEILFILQDSAGTFWVSAVKNSSELLIATTSAADRYEWKNLSFLKSVIDFSNSNAVFTIYKDELTGIVWFCGADGIVSYNSHNLYNPNEQRSGFKALIRKVILKGDSLLFAGDNITKSLISSNDNIALSPNFGSLRFEFSAMTYEGNLSQYQYWLEGFEEYWSAWTSESRKDYTNLSPGKYIFRVRAKNNNNEVSQESRFSFMVLTPWFQSWYMFLVYIILTGFVIYLITRIRVKYLTQRNIKLEYIINERTKVISEQADKLKQLDEIKSRFFTNISHEFRTPLTLTLGQIESVMSTLQDINLKKKLQMGYQNAKKLLRLINQLLEISKIESGKHKLKVSQKDIVLFVRQIFFTFESIADQKGISLEFKSEMDEIPLYFDAEKMDKVFTNLISNAIKFTNEGGKIFVEVSEKKELSLEERDTVEIVVKDSGIGIPKDRLPYIFDRFYQADRIDRSDIEGTGIGLTLAKEFVELHSGKIEVDSELGKGTSIKVILFSGKDHFNSDEISETIAKIDPEFEMDPSLLSNKLEEEITDDIEDEINVKESVLVVDDNADIRQFIREQLEDSFQIYEANDGINGIKLAAELIPNLIITDLRMPGIDGFEVIKKLKQDTITSHIPIIILTAKSDQKDKITGLETGADDYLVKPFSTQELIVRVKNLITTRKRLRERYSKTASFNPSDVTESSIDQLFLEKVIKSINDNISNTTYSVDQLAKDVAFSVSQLNRKLKALIDQPAGLYIRTIRLEKAAEMLKNKVATVKEIAFAVGFTEQSNFAKSFKKYFGISPSEYNIEQDQPHK